MTNPASIWAWIFSSMPWLNCTPSLRSSSFLSIFRSFSGLWGRGYAIWLSSSLSTMKLISLSNPLNSLPPFFKTLKHSFQIPPICSEYTFATGWKMRSKKPSSKGKFSVISACTRLIFIFSLFATVRSFSSWAGVISSTVISAPSAAKTGPCWPPPEIRASTFLPTTSLIQLLSTCFVGVRKSL